MRIWTGLVIAALVAGCAGAPDEDVAPGQTPRTNRADPAFTDFYNKFKSSLSGSQARIFAAGFEDRGIVPYRVAQNAAKAQPELTKTFEEYVGPMLKEERVAVARQKLEENQEFLGEIANRTGVPAEVIVALWGIETSFGKVQGTHPVIPALATLAWDSHRQEFYNKELHAALELIERNELSPTVKGSWAGAMGQPQFMPSTYLRAGMDGDHDDHVDLFNSLPDVFASTANLLKLNGWQRGLAWRLPIGAGANIPDLPLNARGLSEPFNASGTGVAGIIPGQMYRYYRPTNGPGFLLGPNFTAVLKWNNSSYFAYSVLTLADMLKEGE